MINLFLFAFICYGACNIMVHGSIFESWRVFWLTHNPNFMGKLFTCMMCLPFWVGAFYSYFVYSITAMNHIANGYIGNFADACLASGVVWFIHTIQEAFERYKNKKD